MEVTPPRNDVLPPTVEVMLPLTTVGVPPMTVVLRNVSVCIRFQIDEVETPVRTYPVALATVTLVMLCGMTAVVALARMVELIAARVAEL